MIRILFYSYSGNTKSFMKRLVAYAESKHELDEDNLLIEGKEINDMSLFEKETKPYFVFVPTYLDGGNGQDNGTDEIITNVLGEYIGENDNAKLCLGIVGSGNKNFNWQYCLTAKQYAEKYALPFIADFELRGTEADAKRIYEILLERVKTYE